MKIVDVARGAYARSPAWLRRSAGHVLSLAPPALLMGRQFREWRTVVERTETDAEFTAAFQTRCLRGLLLRCARKAPFYRPMLPGPEAIAAAARQDLLQMLAGLPVLDKAQVRQHGAAMLCVGPAEAEEVSTSGTSGEPLSFYLDRDRSVREWAFVTRIWSRIGFDDRSVRGVLRGVQLPGGSDAPWNWDPALRELRLSPFHLTEKAMDAYLGLAGRYRVNFLHGYPSAIEILASHALRRDWPGRAAIRGILPISESMFEHQRALFATAFPNARTMAFYGLSEKSAIAGELPNHPGLYVFEPAYGLTELVDDEGRAVTTPGRSGRVLGTGFISAAMPLLRYDTGDFAELVEPPSPANCFRMQLRGLTSRWSQESLIGRRGERISMAAINIHSRAYAHIRAFQFMQERPGEAVLKIAPVAGAPQALIAGFVAEIMAKVQDALTVTVAYTEEFKSNSRGKRPFIDQRIPAERARSLSLPQDGSPGPH